MINVVFNFDLLIRAFFIFGDVEVFQCNFQLLSFSFLIIFENPNVIECCNTFQNVWLTSHPFENVCENVSPLIFLYLRKVFRDNFSAAFFIFN